MKNLVSADIVIVGKNLNPSIFSAEWLIDEGIIVEEDIVEDPVYNPMVASVTTSSFKLQALFGRIQITFTAESPDVPKLAIGIIKDIIKKLPPVPNLPYLAIGLNMRIKKM